MPKQYPLQYARNIDANAAREAEAALAAMRSERSRKAAATRRANALRKAAESAGPSTVEASL